MSWSAASSRREPGGANAVDEVRCASVALGHRVQVGRVDLDDIAPLGAVPE